MSVFSLQSQILLLRGGLLHSFQVWFISSVDDLDQLKINQSPISYSRTVQMQQDDRTIHINVETLKWIAFNLNQCVYRF